MATRKTVKMKATKVDSRKPKVDTKARQNAHKAELAATAKEEELAKTLVKAAAHRKLVVRVKECESLLESLYADIVNLDTRLAQVEQAEQQTMWQSVKKFFGRKIW